MKKGLKKEIKKSICITEIDKCDEEGEAEEDNQEDNTEEIFDPNTLDLCIAGSEKDICFNCGGFGHYS
jgi:hypothetical protein